ncbi:hypothetical protein FKM82_024565 [Ascaphus truei]
MCFLPPGQNNVRFQNGYQSSSTRNDQCAIFLTCNGLIHAHLVFGIHFLSPLLARGRAAGCTAAAYRALCQ